MHLAFFGGMPGGMEVLIILFVILLLFGGKKLPELARSLGKSLGEFRKGREEGAKEEALPGHDKSSKLDSTEADEPPPKEPS